MAGASAAAEAETELTFDGDESEKKVEPSRSSDTSETNMCVLGDGFPRVRGSIFCPDHKKISDNVYNGTKKETGGTGAEWDNFKDQKKRGTTEYQQMILAAAPFKSGGGKGKKTEKFSAVQHFKSVKTITRQKTGTKKVFKTLVGFTNHCKTEMGWSIGRSKAEWDFLKEKASPDDLKNTLDRLSKEDIEWMRIPLEDYTVHEDEVAEEDDVRLEGHRKKNPTEEDMQDMRAAASAGHVSFSDKMYAPLKVGSADRTSVFATGAVSMRSRMKAHWGLGSLRGRLHTGGLALKPYSCQGPRCASYL